MGGKGIAGLDLGSKRRGRLSDEATTVSEARKAAVLTVPDCQGEHCPDHPWLQGAVADAQQQRGSVVETPFVATAQVAVYDLVRE